MTSRPTPTARQSTPKRADPPIISHSTALVSPSASLTGNYEITLGPNTVIQLRSHLSSVAGPIKIGEDCVIHERASIGLLSADVPQIQRDDRSISGISLGQGVLIEPEAMVEAMSIGAFTVIETGAKIGRGAVVGKNCKICACAEVREEEVIGDNVIVFGNGWDQRRMDRRDEVMSATRERWVMEQGLFLRKTWTGK